MQVNPARLNGVRLRHRGYLPHWQLDDAIYFVTYRLADSLPPAVIEALRERQQAIRRAIAGASKPSIQQRLEISRLFGAALDDALDRGSGQCLLADSRIASVVVENLEYHDGKDHRLLSWCVMPNHVHVVMYVSKGEALPRVVQRWKSFTAKRANEILGRAGVLWQPEYFDRIVRSEEDFVDTTEYVLNNPLKAGLAGWPWVSSVGR